MELAHKSGRAFPLVLLDYQMPDMDGFQVAERIAQSPHLAGATIMMLSSAGQQGDGLRCRELGVAAYLNKPIRQSVLLEAVLVALALPAPGTEARTLVTRHSLREGHSKAHGTAQKDSAHDPLLTDGLVPPVARPLGSLRVLVAEDNRVNQMVIRKLLEKLGHKVTVCGDGRATVAAVEADRPDIVLMDIQMPGMDGFAATAAIRAREVARRDGGRLPVVALTAFAMKGDRERCLAAGMDEYMAKPIKRDELVAVLVRLAGEAPGRIETEEPGPSKAGEPGPVLDAAAALMHAGGDRQLVGQLLDVFLADCPGQMQAVRDAVAGADSLALMHASHALGGSLRVLGASAATVMIGRLEVLGRESRLDGAAALLARFEPELVRVQGAARDAERPGSSSWT